MNHHRRLASIATVALLVCCTMLLAGCSSSKEPVLHGTVTYKDQPVTGGTVKLVPSNAGNMRATPYQGAIAADGTYTIAGIPRDADMKVIVETESVKAMAQAYNRPQPPGGRKVQMAVDPALLESAPHYTPIPPRYANPYQTPLEVTITGGKQRFDVDLTD